MRKDPSSVRIRDVLLEMRRYRMGLIQTADQLRFSYLAVIEGAKYIKGDTSLQVSHSSLTAALCTPAVVSSSSQNTKPLFVFVFRSRGRSSRMKKTIRQSSPLLLLFLLPETRTMTKLSHPFSQKKMRSSNRWISAVWGKQIMSLKECV